MIIREKMEKWSNHFMEGLVYYFGIQKSILRISVLNGISGDQ